MRAMRTRCWAAVVAVTVIVTGCSGSGGGDDADDQAAEIPVMPAPAGTAAPPATMVAGRATTGKPVPREPALATVAPTTEPPRPPQVSVDVAIGPNVTVVAGEAALSGQPADPFGEFAACSGLRDSVANWSLQVSDPDQTVTSVSILTVAGVTGPGAYDGTFRVEFVNGAALDGVGTVTLDPGLQSGTFTATDADLSGSFTCTGAPAPAPLDTPDVEVVALMRRGSAERMVSLSEPYSATTECVGSAGRVQVTGDAGIGGLVELTIDAGALAITIGGVDVGIDPAHTELAIDGTTGTFHAVTLDGMEIDGAFTCAPAPAAPAPTVEAT